MKDQSYQPVEPRYLHQVDLGPVMPEEAVRRAVYEGRGGEVVKAVLQFLRDRSAEDRQAAAACSRNGHYAEKDGQGNVHVLPMNDPVFHNGCAQGYEDAFWGLWEMTKVKKEDEKKGAG